MLSNQNIDKLGSVPFNKPDFPIPMPTFEKAISTLSERWLIVYRQHKVIMSILLEQFNGNTGSIHNAFLAITRAIEAYHVIKHKKKITLKQRIKMIVDEFNGELSSEIDLKEDIIKDIVDLRNDLTHSCKDGGTDKTVVYYSKTRLLF